MLVSKESTNEVLEPGIGDQQKSSLLVILLCKSHFPTWRSQLPSAFKGQFLGFLGQEPLNTATSEQGKDPRCVFVHCWLWFDDENREENQPRKLISGAGIFSGVEPVPRVLHIWLAMPIFMHFVSSWAWRMLYGCTNDVLVSSVWPMCEPWDRLELEQKTESIHTGSWVASVFHASRLLGEVVLMCVVDHSPKFLLHMKLRIT